MAQLPPKIPTMTPSWSPFSHHHHPHHHKTPSMNAASPHPSWVDEFLDFSSARRSVHRRSASDSAAFLDERGGDCPSSFDDGQLASMFSDENAANSSPCTPSDHDSANEARVKNDGAGAGEVESSCKYEALPPPPPPGSSENGSGSSLDPKRVKRILANRQSAQRSRVRKLQYISELERSVTSLQTEVSTLSPRVAYLDHQRLVLNVDNSALKQRIAALAQDKIFKDAHQEALKQELERLRQVYHQQNLKNMADPDNDNAPNAASIDNADEQQDQN